MEKFIASFYKFVNLSNLFLIRDYLLDLNIKNDIKGSIIIANEGINGSISGIKNDVQMAINEILNIDEFFDLKVDFNLTKLEPFKSFKIKIKKEIVTIGDKKVKPINSVGIYIKPNYWDNFINQKDVILIDTRNKYEVKIGTFKKAVNPMINNFSEFPEWWNKNKNKFKAKKIAMFCTGGIRCEKSTSLVLESGFKDVYHLEGGIIGYLKQPTAPKNCWEGECFVFDQRVSVLNGVKEGNYKLCFGCRRPISVDDINHENYEEGVSCSYCINEHSSKRKDGFRERQRQKILFNKKK